MTSRKLLGFMLAFLALAFLGLSSFSEADEAKTTETMRIGLVGSLFTDVPQPLINLLSSPFKSLMKEFTGLNGELAIGGEVPDVARRLNNKELDLAVFHGVEYGWVRQKYTELQPLMIAINKYKHCRAHLVVKADGDIKGFADLKGKEVSLPRRSKLHCRMFLEHNCGEYGSSNAKSLVNVVASPGTEAALDDILRGKVQAAVIDTVQLEFYESIKPGCFARLKTVQNSEVFPSAVIAYRKGALDEVTLKKFKDGMLSANKSDRGRTLMSQWYISGFEPVPDDYDQVLADILKVYPGPEELRTAHK